MMSDAIGAGLRDALSAVVNAVAALVPHHQAAALRAAPPLAWVPRMRLAGRPRGRSRTGPPARAPYSGNSQSRGRGIPAARIAASAMSILWRAHASGPRFLVTSFNSGPADARPWQRAGRARCGHHWRQVRMVRTVRWPVRAHRGRSGCLCTSIELGLYRLNSSCACASGRVPARRWILRRQLSGGRT